MLEKVVGDKIREEQAVSDMQRQMMQLYWTQNNYMQYFLRPRPAYQSFPTIPPLSTSATIRLPSTPSPLTPKTTVKQEPLTDYPPSKFQ